MNKYELYAIDTETNGLSPVDHSPIEISIIRISTNEQRTWLLKPIDVEKTQPDALRINGHKLEDLKGLTKEGREKYIDPNKILIEIENWLLEDMSTAMSRLIVGHNSPFDRSMLIELWRKCNSSGTFPFNNRHSMDTMQIELVSDLVKGAFSETGYSLNSLCKKYGIVNSKAHSASADILATTELFKKQIEYFGNLSTSDNHQNLSSFDYMFKQANSKLI